MTSPDLGVLDETQLRQHGKGFHVPGECKEELKDAEVVHPRVNKSREDCTRDHLQIMVTTRNS